MVRNNSKKQTAQAKAVHSYQSRYAIMVHDLLSFGKSSSSLFAKPTIKEPTKFDDTFSGFTPHNNINKKDADDDTFSFSGKKKNKNQSSSLVNKQTTMDQAILHLLEAEKMEADATLPWMDLRDTNNNNSSSSAEETLKFRSDCVRIQGMIQVLRQYTSHSHLLLDKYYVQKERMETLKSSVQALEHLLSNESLHLFPDFQQRKALLQHLGYTSMDDTVCVKGRVACELSTCGEELIATEIIFDGIFSDLEPPEIAAVLSAFVFQQNNSKEEGDPLESKELPEKLRQTCLKIKEIALKLEHLQKQFGIENVGDYCNDSLKFGLVHVVYEWACGVPFANICQLTTVPEGSIVRCMTRLDELCREVRNSSRVVGNPTLYRKMEAASIAIKRDIVFASSLYIT